MSCGSKGFAFRASPQENLATMMNTKASGWGKGGWSGCVGEGLGVEDVILTSQSPNTVSSRPVQTLQLWFQTHCLRDIVFYNSSAPGPLLLPHFYRWEATRITMFTAPLQFQGSLQKLALRTRVCLRNTFHTNQNGCNRSPKADLQPFLARF